MVSTTPPTKRIKVMDVNSNLAQEALRKRQEDEERQAQQAEFLNRSLRGSRKLQALESHPSPSPPQGVINDGYSSEETEDATSAPGGVKEDLHAIISYGDLVASLQRLQLVLKKASVEPELSSLEGQVAAVQTLLLSREFRRALTVHNKVLEALTHRQGQGPVATHSQSLVRECLDAIQPCSLADAAELSDLLTRYELEGLLLAHDNIALQHSAIQSPSNTEVMVSPVDDDTSEKFPQDANIKIIKIEKTNEPLGATVRNEGDAVIIGRIVKGGAAEKSGLLHEGDEVLEVNGIEMRGKSVNEVCDILSGMTGTLTFLIVPEIRNRQPHSPTRDTLMNVKAHFDYDPEDDLYIPCRELGISFQKGDILHIISQDDPNWWQAFREGEEDQSLAGLIPSRTFQHQREAMKQAITGEKTTKEKSKKAGTLLCAKKNQKKKKKKAPYGSYNDGGYPLYTTSTADDYDADEILTYEEVLLYYPRANHKRPVVLIGPPNIGRHELRQRLMEDSERFAAAIPHTSRARKDGEVDGHDYHFISRAQFELDILSRKFVEHGEYEKAYYGTSLDAIRSVVNSGKICVLNLHPQSLKILRNSDLKPFVVFVAPPSLEKLQQKKMNGELYKDDELKDIIEKAREMEDKYGHYFDMIMVNNDTDRAFHQLINEINILEREPQWVPATWLKPRTCGSTVTLVLDWAAEDEEFGVRFRSLRQRMNNHRFDTNHKDPDKAVPIHAGTHNQDFQTCYTTKTLRAFPKQCNSSQLRQWKLAHQWINKLRLPPGLNRR
uniref:MAGUK p55 subfamily member 5 n=1 Tax=Timema cristinae TaxID=61476 RepID=A0A7R9H170_TIMCR|nr:unnamed protein product [Timema cristinae]